MIWSLQQDIALCNVQLWLKNPHAPQVYRLFGFAGTGKSTLAKYFAEGIDGTVLFCAYTGKAAYVMRQKGCPGASTIHSLIYKSKEKSRMHLLELERKLVDLQNALELSIKGTKPHDILQKGIRKVENSIEVERKNLAQPMFALNDDSAAQYAQLIIIDECSMVDGKMGEDLLSFGTKILVLGDPAQLPPVFGGGFFTRDLHPNTMLTDIHRQALDNPIIAMATQVRQCRPLGAGKYGNSYVGSSIAKEEGLAADQILVGRNRTRHMYNQRMRSLQGITESYPVPGDRLVCLRNNHDKGLLNGAIWHVEDIGDHDADFVVLTIKSDNGEAPITVEAHAGPFRGETLSMPWWDRTEAEELGFGYALTVHKSQGSQWENVVLFDESDCFRQNKWRWLYTGITRASEKIKVVT